MVRSEVVEAGEALATLRTAIDAVASIDPAAIHGADAFGEALESLKSLDRRLDHEWHRLLRAFDARGDCKPLGYRTTAQWCRDRLRASRSTVSRELKLGRALSSMPTVQQRWAQGRIGAEHAQLIAAAHTDDTTHAFPQWEEWMADQAEHLDHRGLRICLARWKLRVAPDTDEPEKLERDRDAHVSQTFGGAVVVDATLAPIGGSSFQNVFDRLVDEMFKADWAQAKQRLGRDPLHHELRRTPAQRRADALVEMAVRAEMCDTPHWRRPRPLITVVAGLDALADGIAELWNQTPITSKQLARLLATDPDIERYVYGTDEQPIAYNERSRCFTGKLRRAIQVRDRTCTALGCDLPAQRCDIDHITPVTRGGLTTPTNGRVSCNPDNRARTQGRRHKGDPSTPNAP